MKKHSLLFTLLLALMVPMAAWAQAPSPIVPYEETFESYSVGARPVNWSFSSNGIVNGNVSYGVNTTNGLNGTKCLRMVTPAVTTSSEPVHIIAMLPAFDYQAGFLHLYFNSKFTSAGTGTNTKVKLQVGYVDVDNNNTFHKVSSDVSPDDTYGTEHHYSFVATSNIPTNARIAFRQVSLEGARFAGTWDIDNVNVVIDARLPFNVVASNITNTSAVLSWEFNYNCSYFEIEYADNAQFNSAINVPTNYTTKTLTDLSPNTNYYVRVRAKYIDNNSSNFVYGSWWPLTGSYFTTTCDVPTGLSVDPVNITETNIRVTWDDNLIKDVDLEYKKSSESNWMTLAHVDNDNSYVMSVSGLNLQAGTLYQVRAKFPCSDWCEPIEFRTAFGGLNELMYTFEDGMPADFTVTGAGAENVSLSTEQSFGADPHSLKYSFVSGNPYPSPGTYTYVGIETYLKTYQFNDFMVYFDMYCTDTPGTAESVELQYDAWVTSGSGTWQSIWRSAGSWGFSWSEQGWVERKGTFSIPTELQGGVSKLRFRLVFTDHSSGESTYVDNIHIFPKGDCSNINTNYFNFYDPTESSISFDWVDPNYDASVSPVAHSNGFCIRYRNLTIPTNTNTGWIEEYVYADNTNPQQQYTYMLNNLDPSSYYLINIRTICPDGGSTGWLSTNLNMGTDCQAYKLTDMQPFTEDFDNLLLNPACWTYTTNWNRIYDGYGGHNWCLRSNYNPVAGWSDYIDTPEIELNDNYVSKGSSYLVLRFWTKCSGSDGTGNKVKVLVGDQEVEIYEMPEYGCDQWQQIHLSLSRWLPDNDESANAIRVRFDHGSSAAAEWFIDDVVITSWDQEYYGTKVFDDAVRNDRDWTKDDNWYPYGAPTYSPSMNVTLMGMAWMPANSESTVGTMRFGTLGYLDVQPGSNLSITEVDIPEAKVFVEQGATLNIGTAHFGFDKIFTYNEGTYNITNLNVDDHCVNFNNGTVLLDTVTLTAPGWIVAMNNTLNVTTVNSSGLFDVLSGATVNIGTLNAYEGSPFNVVIEGSANITTLNANGSNSVMVRNGGMLNATTINSDGHDRLVIEDGGQVKSGNAFYGIIEKNISGYGATNVNDRLNWYLIASPIDISINDPLVPLNGTELDFDKMDLYRFVHYFSEEWRNEKCTSEGGCDSPAGTYPQGSIYGSQLMVRSTGYLYSSQDDMTVNFSTAQTSSSFSATDEDVEVYINYDNSNTDVKLAGMNLIGNPYTCNAYLKQDGNYIPFYKMNDTGDAIVGVPAGTPIKPCEAVFVCCTEPSSTVTITTTEPAGFGENTEYRMVLLPPHTLCEDQDASPTTLLIGLDPGWNWIAPSVEVIVAAMQDELGSDAVICEEENIRVIAPGQMVKVHVAEEGTYELSGRTVPASSVTIHEGNNWIGYTGTTAAISTALTTAFGTSFVPNIGDKIISQDNGFAIYNGTTWKGTLTSLEQGRGYIYVRPLTE